MPNAKSLKISNLDNRIDESLTPMDRKKLIKKLRTEMKIAATDLNFELAATIRDKIHELEGLKN